MSSLPKVVIHSEISVDGSIKGFQSNMFMYYGIVSQSGSKVTLLGSETALKALPKKLPEENKGKDFKKPSNDKSKPYWCLIDSSAKLMHKLHYFRNLQEYISDIFVLISGKTSPEYIRYLKERDYDFHVCGDSERVDLREGLKFIKSKYDSNLVYTDSGGVLNSVLLDEGLVDEVSLLFHPVLVGDCDENSNIFRDLKKKVCLETKSVKMMDLSHVHIVYGVKKKK